MPLQMGADGDLTADAWYRAHIQAPTAGPYTLACQRRGPGDRLMSMECAQGVEEFIRDIPVTLEAGSHTLAVFTAHDGRDKLFGYVGSIEMSDPKGLAGPVTLRQGSGTALNAVAGAGRARMADAVKAGPPAADADGWQPYTVGDDAFNKRRGFAWFQTTLPASVGAAHVSLHFESVDDNGTVFVNGKQVGSHQGWDTAFDVPLTAGPEAVLSVFVENTDNTGGLDKPVRLVTQIGEEVTTTGWKLRGGPGDPLSSCPAGNRSLPGQPFAGPAFFQTTLYGRASARRRAASDLARGLRPASGTAPSGSTATTWGAIRRKCRSTASTFRSAGWSPARIPLVIYDEDGKRPDQVTVAAEAAASRDVTVLDAPEIAGRTWKRGHPSRPGVVKPVPPCGRWTARA